MPSQPHSHLAAIVGANLVRLRDERDLKQRQVAAQLDTDVMTVSRWERGKHKPADHTLMRLAEFYGVPFSSFFEEKKSAA